jgi:hypothetical protein
VVPGLRDMGIDDALPIISHYANLFKEPMMFSLDLFESYADFLAEASLFRPSLHAMARSEDPPNREEERKKIIYWRNNVQSSFIQLWLTGAFERRKISIEELDSYRLPEN